MKKAYSIVLWLVLVMAGLVLAGCSGVVQGQSTDAEPTLAPVVSADSLMAEGKVVPLQSAALSFSTSGVVAEVLVKQGETVQAGQPLLRLKGNEQLEAKIASAEFEVLTAQQSLDDLVENLDLRRAEAKMEIAEARKELDKAQKRATSKDFVRGSQDQIDTAEANLLLAQRDFEDTEELYNGVRGGNEVSEADALTLLAAARQRRDSAQANLNYLRLKPNPLDVAQLDAQLALAEAKLASAEQKLERIKDGPDAEQVTLAEARLKNAKIQQAAAQSSLKDLELTAPFDATVISVDATPGTFVQPGAAMLQLADVANWLVETTDLTERDIATIRMGMPATVRFDALPDVELIGRVERIDLLGQNHQGDIVYTVRLKLDQPDERLRWNMTTSLIFLEN